MQRKMIFLITAILTTFPAWADDLPIGTAASQHLGFEEQSAQTKTLNNEGVRALNESNYDLAVSKFEQALEIDPKYRTARMNLAIACNNLGLRLGREPEKALRAFHKSLYLDPRNATTRSNVDAAVSSLGKKPESFDDRELLGKEAELAGDFTGALIEFGAACRIKDDRALRSKMQVLISTQHLRGDPSDYIDQGVLKPSQDVDYSLYFADIQRRIKRAWFPPKDNHSVVVYFRIYDNGDVGAIRLRASSGSESSDEAALFAVKNALPFRKLPDGAGEHIDIKFTFDDNLFDDSGSSMIKLL
jgi:TonB family protein